MTDYYRELSQEEQERLRELIRKLFRQTFILERIYDRKAGRMTVNKDYYFCEKHMEFLKEYLAVAGIAIQGSAELGAIYIQSEAGLGEKLPMLATIYLLLLKLIYDEKMAAVSDSLNIVTTLGELNGKAGEFRLVRTLSSATEMRRALTVLRRYQLIELPDSMEDLNEHTRIFIFPSINVVLMREDIERLLDTFGEEAAPGEPSSSAVEREALTGAAAWEEAAPGEPSAAAEREALTGTPAWEEAAPGESSSAAEREALTGTPAWEEAAPGEPSSSAAEREALTGTAAWEEAVPGEPSAAAEREENADREGDITNGL